MKESELKNKKMCKKLPDLEEVIEFQPVFKKRSYLFKTDNVYKIGDESNYVIVGDFHISSPEDIVKYKRKIKNWFKKDIADVIEKEKEIGVSKNIVFIHVRNNFRRSYGPYNNGLCTDISNDFKKNQEIIFNRYEASIMIDSFSKKYFDLLKPKEKK